MTNRLHLYNKGHVRSSENSNKKTNENNMGNPFNSVHQNTYKAKKKLYLLNKMLFRLRLSSDIY